MASQSSFFSENFTTQGNKYPGKQTGPGRGRAGSLPEPRQAHPYRYARAAAGGGGENGIAGRDMMGTWSEGFDEVQSEPANTASAWKRAIKVSCCNVK